MCSAAKISRYGKTNVTAMFRSSILTLLISLCTCSIIQGQSVTLFPADTAICKGNSVKLTAFFHRGTFRYIGTYDGKDYFMDTVSRSWTESRSVAQANGLDLWIIDSLNENNAVYNLIPYRSRTDVMFWFGLYQDQALDTANNPKDGWKWLDGRSLDTTFRNWYFNEPDNAFQTKFPANHAAIGFNTMGAFWGDMADTLPPGFNAFAIAEADAQPLQYTWSSGQNNTSTINVGPPLTTSYTVTLNYGASTFTSNTTTVTVNNPAGLASFNIASSSEFCFKRNRVALVNTTATQDPLNIKYDWELGDGSTSKQNSFTYSYGAPQTYSVKLTATDKNGCFTSSQKPVTILSSPLTPFITLTPTGKNVFCQGDSVSLNSVVLQPDPNVKFNWYRGIDSVFTGKPYIARSSGNYSIVAINENGCKDTAAVNITVNPLPRKPSISFSSGFNGVICAIDTTSLTAQSPDPPFRYVWYKAGSPQPAILVQTVGNTNTIRAATNVGQIPITEYFMVRILDAKNCYSPFSDSISVTTRPSPIVAISTNGRSSSFCDGDSVKLWGTSSPAGNTFSWTRDFTPIPGNDSSIIVRATGSYRMIATNSFGCSRVSNGIAVFVNRYPAVPSILLDPNIAELLPNGTASICNASSTTLRINQVPSANYQWFRDNLPILNARSTSLNVNLAGDYRIAVTVNNCTTNSLVQKVSVRPAPAGTLQVPSSTILCEGGSVKLDANGSFGYQWYFNNVLITGANDSSILAINPGVYRTEFIDNKGCKRLSANFVNLTIVRKPFASFNYDLYCVNTLSNFTNQSQSNNSGSVDYLWRFQNGVTSNTFNTTHIFPDTGVYRVSLAVIPQACPELSDSAVSLIRVQQPVRGIRYDPVNAEVSKPIGLISRPIGDLYQWRPTTGLNSPFIRIPILTPSTEQLYTVSITNRAGCITTDSVLVRIFDEQNIYVAGAFTPNRDGKNDRVYPILVGVDVFNYLKIFNRWGTLVYQSNSIDPEKGWDGTYKGIDQPADTYTWIVDAVGQNGKPIRKSGSIVLIR